MIETDDLLGVPWREGGRQGDAGIDCLGVALVVLARAGIEAQDPWDELLACRWRDGATSMAAEMPRRWRPARPPYVPGDLAAIHHGEHVAAYLGAGWWASSKERCGFYRFRSRRFAEVWRWVA